MLRRVIHWKLGRVEAELGESVDYLRHVVDVSVPAFLKFTKILPFAAYRKRLPADAANVARIVASRDEDCGTCVQIAINVAKSEGVPDEVLQAVIERAPDRLDDGLADVYAFGEAVVGQTGEEGPIRERLTARYGEEGVIELAYALASARIFPVVKRALGYATSCKAVTWRV